LVRGYSISSDLIYFRKKDAFLNFSLVIDNHGNLDCLACMVLREVGT